MDMIMQDAMTNLYSQDRELQTQAYMRLMVGTEQPVDWAYVVWDELLVALRHQDNHVRSIAAQVLCNLAQSDPELRIRKDFAALLAVTRDERFVTARHCLQALWKVGIAGETQRDLVLEGFASRFVECAAEKNASLIRYDIQVGLRSLYDHTGDERIRDKALALIEMEQDLKYRKKYAGVWKNKESAVRKRTE